MDHGHRTVLSPQRWYLEVRGDIVAGWHVLLLPILHQTCGQRLMGKSLALAQNLHLGAQSRVEAKHQVELQQSSLSIITPQGPSGPGLEVSPEHILSFA